MKNSIEIIDAIARAYGDCTDYRVSKITGIPPQKISRIRAGKCSMSRANCKKAALILGVEPGALIAIAQAEREEDPEIAASLLRLARVALAARAPQETDRVCVLCKVLPVTKRPPTAGGFLVLDPPLNAAISAGLAAH
jgi:hypothetical protein